MRYHSQNLNEHGSKLLNGRAWLHTGTDNRDRTVRWEWCLFGKSRGFGFGIWFGHGDGNDEINFHFSLPFLLSLYIGIDRLLELKDPCEFGFSIHDNGMWFKLLAYSMKSSHDDPWWRKTYCVRFPWDLDWYSTEILHHDKNIPNARVIWSETRKNRKDFFGTWDEREAAKARVSRDYPFTYVLKNRAIQQRTATVHVVRMRWRARWYPLIPVTKTRTSIDVKFDQEVGEGTGSWKGGTVGCGYDMNPGESPEHCLWRMEHGMIFGR